MADEQQEKQTKQETPKDETETKEENNNDLSPLDEAKQILDEQKKVLVQLTEERKKIEKALGNAAIAGKGFSTQQTPKKEETNEEYTKRVLHGDL